MLTDEEIRGLLKGAAATINVPASTRIITRPRRWAVPVVAAAAVAAAVAAGFTLVDHDRSVAPQPLTLTPTPTPTQQTPPPRQDRVGASLANGLIRFANRTPGSHFPGDARVRLYNDGVFWNSLSPTQAEDADSYSLCSGLDPAHCPASFLSLLALEGPYTLTHLAPDCVKPGRIVGRERGGGTHTVFVVSRAGTSCFARSVIQLRYDPPSRLVAVNVISAGRNTELDDRALADRFIGFARGTSESLPIDTPVRLYQNETYVRTMTAAQANQRESYRNCGERPCIFSAIDAIKNIAEIPAIRRSSDVPACLEAHPPALTEEMTGGTRSMLISDVDGPCDFGVQLWINDASQIVAIDLRVHKMS